MPVGPQRRTPPQERHAFGLMILAPSHPEVRRLQQTAARPSLHGQKVWPTSFVLLDYLQQRGVAPQARVLELGCGWGLVGIACAKTFQAHVTGLDADAAVFPYLQLHAQRNGVHIATRQSTFADLAPQELAAFELIVGADICFWEDLVDPLYRLVRYGVAVGVAEILVADPGRPPFDELCARCLQHGDAEVLAWATTTPVTESGRILRVVGPAKSTAYRPRRQTGHAVARAQPPHRGTEDGGACHHGHGRHRPRQGLVPRGSAVLPRGQSCGAFCCPTPPSTATRAGRRRRDVPSRRRCGRGPPLPVWWATVEDACAPIVRWVHQGEDR